LAGEEGGRGGDKLADIPSGTRIMTVISALDFKFTGHVKITGPSAKRWLTLAYV